MTEAKNLLYDVPINSSKPEDCDALVKRGRMVGLRRKVNPCKISMIVARFC